MDSKTILNLYSDDEFCNIVTNSSSYTDCLRNLGYDYKSSSRYKLLKERISRLAIDVSHFNCTQINGGKTRVLMQQEEAHKRIDEYNKSPNLCLNCGAPILAPYDKPLKETKIKKFCSHSCAAKYSNTRRESHAGWTGLSKIDNIDDVTLLKYFNESNSIKDFKTKIGYKGSLPKNGSVAKRLENLGLHLDDIDTKKKTEKIRNSLTKGELFAKRKNWQSARGDIQHWAKQNYDKSDKPKECLICKYPHYEVAHLRAVSDFPDEAMISEINSVDNLVALCRNHHFEYDSGLLSRETLEKLIEK